MKDKEANTTNTSEDNLGGVIASLRSVIDRIDSNFREAKDLILELARRLDEEHVLKQDQVCRKIKEILEDKISQGKISEKWIEECLPAEYKRKYTKSELSSLSQQEVATKELSNQPLIRVGNAGDELLTHNDDGGDTNPSTIDGLSFLDKDVDNNDSSNLAQYDAKTVTPRLVEFEFSLPFEEVRIYMTQIFQLNKGLGRVYFHGSVDIRTGKVISPSTGSLQRQL
ncbi:MAG: hypothetical protein WCC17_20310 [Candidatus Nitrosopolaris sp.]